jgi:hypothetical protein
VGKPDVKVIKHYSLALTVRKSKLESSSMTSFFSLC